MEYNNLSIIIRAHELINYIYCSKESILIDQLLFFLELNTQKKRQQYENK